MFLVCLFLAFAFILALIFKHGRSKHKKLITITIFMIMGGMICWGYNDIVFADGYRSSLNNRAFYALVNQRFIFVIGMALLALSIPCTLFCLLSKPKEVREIDKWLEDQDD